MCTETKGGIGYEIFKNVVSSLLTLLELSNKGVTPTISEFLEKSGISRSVFFNHLKRNLESWSC